MNNFACNLRLTFRKPRSNKAVNSFYRAMHFASRGIATVSRPSVRPSVRLFVPLSVRDVDVRWAYMRWVITKVITRTFIAYRSSLIGVTTSAVWSKGNTPKIRVEWGWGHSSQQKNLQYL